MNKEYENNDMWHYLIKHGYVNEKKNSVFELSQERAECIANKYRTLTEEKDKQLDKYKNVIDKIKELVENNTELYRHDMDLTDYRTTMNTSGFIKALLELLEEIE